MSSLRLRTATLKALNRPDSGPVAAALDRLVADTDQFDEYTGVLPLAESETGEWTVVLDSASGTPWRYTPQDGLRTH